MKIFVDTLPKNCFECPCFDGFEHSCRAKEKDGEISFDEKIEKNRLKDCPLIKIKTIWC
jgi:hypothetical protein